MNNSTFTSLSKSQWSSSIFIWVLFLLAHFPLQGAFPFLTYHLHLLALVPGILLSLNFGIQAAFVSTMAIVLMVFGSSSETETNSLIYLFGAGLAFITVGFMSTTQKKLNRKIACSNSDLQQSNDELNLAIANTQKLAHTSFIEQEQWRKALSQDLHDDLGQKITVLKTQAILAEGETQNDEKNTYIAIQLAANNLYSALKRHLSWLRPASLDEIGLIDTLKYGEVAKTLKQSDIAFSVIADLDEMIIPDDHRVAYYRLCQLIISIWKGLDIVAIHIELESRSNQLSTLRISSQPPLKYLPIEFSKAQQAEMQLYAITANMAIVITSNEIYLHRK